MDGEAATCDVCGMKHTKERLLIKLVNQLQLTSDSINTWKKGVEKALKRYLNDGSAFDRGDDDMEEEA